MQMTPNLIASGNIRPFRFVTMSEDRQAAESNLNEIMVGVCEGSTTDFTSDNHATVGLEISLQTGHIVRVITGEAILFGQRVQSDAEGAAVVIDAAGTRNYAGVAMYDAASGEELEIFWMPGSIVVA